MLSLEFQLARKHTRVNQATYTAFVLDGVVVFIVCSRSSFHVMRGFGCAVKDQTKIFQRTVILRIASLERSETGGDAHGTMV